LILDIDCLSIATGPPKKQPKSTKTRSKSSKISIRVKAKYRHHEGGAEAGGSGFFSAFETCFGLALLPNIHIAKLPGIAGPLAFAFLLPGINC
jgi:hypothetical protein